MTDAADSTRSPTPTAARFALFALLLLVLVVFGRLCSADFVQWDDDQNFGRSAILDQPVGAALRDAWTHFDRGLYAPVTLTAWIFLAAVSQTDRPDAIGSVLNSWVFHTFNVCCHLVATSLVWGILRRLSFAPLAAWLGAAVFAVHPLQVESVAWASGTKDLLGWCFSLAATLFYVRAALCSRSDLDAPPPRSLWRLKPVWMTLALLTALLGMLSKPSAVVVPAALLLVDALLIRRRALRAMVIDLLPFAAFSIAIALVARAAQYVFHIEAVPLIARPLIVGDSLFHYVTQLAWPGTLIVDYGRKPQVVLAQPAIYLRWLLPAAIVIVALLLRRRMPELLAGVLLFIVGVAPVLGLATFQMQGYSTVADHYAYFSLFGVAIIVAAVIQRFGRRHATTVVVALLVAALSIRSFVQAGLWRNSETLLAHSLSANPRSLPMSNNMATVYLTATPSDPHRALTYADQALAIDPNSPIALGNWLVIKGSLGQLAGTDAEIERLLRAVDDPRAASTNHVRRLTLLADGLMAIGRLDQARRLAERAAELMPDSPYAKQSLSRLEQQLRNPSTTRSASAP